MGPFLMQCGGCDVPFIDEKEGDGTDDEKTEEVQANQIHGKDIPLR